jgi:hypothetical protein
MYRPENDLFLKYLHYKYAPYSKDRSLEALDEPHEATQVRVYTANGIGMGDRIITRDEEDPYYERLHNSRNEHNDTDITKKEHNIDITEQIH